MPLPSVDHPRFDDVIEQLAGHHYAIIDTLLPAELLSALDQHFRSLDESEFNPAGIGRAGHFQTNSAIRGDVIRWLDQDSDATDQYFAWMDVLRQRVNREFFLGLFDYECHYAHFPEGNFYKRHLDAFDGVGEGSGDRRLTTILYLNHDWGREDGGQLKMYQGEGAQPFVEILPEYGRMVIFFSDQFPHEVCVANRPRRSVTGWFRVNNSNSLLADPMG